MMLITTGRLKNTKLATNKFMVGIRSIVKAVMTPNHFVIAGVKQNLTKIGQKLIVSRRKIVF